MTTQPEALRLADSLEELYARTLTATRAAAELRRLHAVNKELLEALKHAAEPLTEAEIAAIVREAAKGSSIRRDGSTSERIARAVEAKLKEKKYENNT
jgi:primosomal protein N''